MIIVGRDEKMEDAAGQYYREIPKSLEECQDVTAILNQEACGQHEPVWHQRADAATTMFDPATVLLVSI